MVYIASTRQRIQILKKLLLLSPKKLPCIINKISEATETHSNHVLAHLTQQY